MLELATKLPRRELEEEFRSLGIIPYAPVRRQLLAIVVAVNEKRHTANRERISTKVFRDDAHPGASVRSGGGG